MTMINNISLHIIQRFFMNGKGKFTVLRRVVWVSERKARIQARNSSVGAERKEFHTRSLHDFPFSLQHQQLSTTAHLPHEISDSAFLVCIKLYI